MPDESELIAMRASEAAAEYPERSPGFLLGYVEGWNDAKAGRQYGEGRHGMRHVGDDGHEGCRMVYGRDLQGLRDEVADLRTEIDSLTAQRDEAVRALRRMAGPAELLRRRLHSGRRDRATFSAKVIEGVS